MIKAERKKRDTSKGDSKFQLIKGLLDEGYKQSQIIAITGFKENSVKGYLKRIRKAA